MQDMNEGMKDENKSNKERERKPKGPQTSDLFLVKC